MADTMDELIAENARLRSAFSAFVTTMEMVLDRANIDIEATELRVSSHNRASGEIREVAHDTLRKVFDNARAALSHPTTPQEGTRG